MTKSVYDLAKFMHDNYEIYAKRIGWKTQESCRTEFKDLPENNKRVMLFVAEVVLDFFETGFIVNDVFWIKERQFDRFWERIKADGEHCTYPDREELLEIFSELNIKVTKGEKNEN